jgi:hypothetical protein
MVMTVQSTRWSFHMTRPGLQRHLGTAQSRPGTPALAPVCRRSRAIVTWSGRWSPRTVQPGSPQHRETAHSRLSPKLNMPFKSLCTEGRLLLLTLSYAAISWWRLRRHRHDHLQTSSALGKKFAELKPFELAVGVLAVRSVD